MIHPRSDKHHHEMIDNATNKYPSVTSLDFYTKILLWLKSGGFILTSRGRGHYAEEERHTLRQLGLDSKRLVGSDHD